MLFARNSKLDSIEIYISFLSDILENDNASYKDIFKRIIETSHDVSVGKINYSSVPTEIFDIVSILSLNHSEFFTQINPSEISNSDFKAIKEFLVKDLFEVA